MRLLICVFSLVNVNASRCPRWPVRFWLALFIRKCVSWVHVRTFPHGLKGQNESRRELQNGNGLGPSEGANDWFLGECYVVVFFLVGGGGGDLFLEGI